MTTRIGTPARPVVSRGRIREFRGATVRVSASRGAGQASRSAAATRLSPVVRVFAITLFLPFHWYFGPVTMSPTRLVLLVMLLPCLVMWLNGRAGRMIVSDFAILGYGIWCSISLAAVHGLETGVESGGIIFVETVAPYFLARCFIRSAAQMLAAIRVLFVLVALLLPFAIYEAVTHRTFLLDFFERILPSHPPTMNEPRWGLRRVQAVFEHPILYGVSCGALLAFVHLVMGHTQSAVTKFRRTATIWFAAFLSLSAGPLSALMAQTMLIGWDRVLKNNARRWQLMWLGIAAMYLLISMVSNQSVPAFYLTHFSFDQASAYYRILIWEHGTQSAINNPLFGVGFNRWERPIWMPPSLDMFWLYHAVIHGIPAAFFMFLAFGSMIWSIGFKKGLPEDLLPYKTAFLITMTGYFLVGWTVHFWGSTYILFLFLLGSCSWLLDARPGLSASLRPPGATAPATRAPPPRRAGTARPVASRRG